MSRGVGSGRCGHELMRLVGVAVEGAVADICYTGDVDGDHFVDIAELIQAVGRALVGCGDGQS